MTTLPPCYCGKTHKTIEHRDCGCFYSGCCEPQNGLPHCGRTSYGCWLKDLTHEQLDEIEKLAKATVQGDGDFTWFLIEGEGKVPGGVWRDQCGNMPIVYDADDVYLIDEKDGSLPEDPPFPKDWKDKGPEYEAYIAATVKRQEDYCKTHSDVVFMGHMHPGLALRLVQMARKTLPPKEIANDQAK